ncbi:hypothetical protein [Cohnella herbarum]|uniref:Uncharacterized protein n=1 Tax=Cohnella herbarum TaxID=2728023 RepID=A0A7Z2VFH6_9BACL|nr:hypothetical protein [Cohnella herbarum]QJD82218.1 hypothetical protein HH215_02835 [Cohnella herbarum]
MITERMIRGLGLGCILAGIIRIGMTPSSIMWGFNSTPELLFGLVACIFMGYVSIVLYTVQSKETGVLGLITVLGIMIGNTLTMPILWAFLHDANFENETSLVYSVTQLVGSIGILGGAVVLPILTWRAKVFPRWVVGLMVLMLLSMALPWGEWFAFFWGLSYVGAGYCIWAGKLNRHSSSSINYQGQREVGF